MEQGGVVVQEHCVVGALAEHCGPYLVLSRGPARGRRCLRSASGSALRRITAGLRRDQDPPGPVGIKHSGTNLHSQPRL